MPRVNLLNCRLLPLLLLFLTLLPLPVSASEQITAFVYHRFGDSRHPSTNISLEDFRRHLEILREDDFTVLTLGDVVAHLEQRRPLPDRAAVLTVDDAYRSFLTGAMPLLSEFGVPATLFVSTGSVGGDDFLGWDDLRRLQAEGIEIGNHSTNHDYLLDRRDGETEKEWRQRVLDDLNKSQEALSRNLGQRPGLFAYPYGEYSLDLAEIVRGAGFRAACAQQSGVIARNDDLFALARFPMGGVFTNPDEFRQKLRMRSLPVELLSSADPAGATQNPPLLRFRLDLKALAPGSVRCFVPGQESPELEELPGEPGVFVVRARQPLTGRVSKYTLTASDATGRQWFWYSHLWVFPGR